MKHIWYLVFTAFLLGLGAVPLSASAAQPGAEGSGIVVGYYAGWSAAQGYSPLDVPAEHLTHLNYAFAGIDGKSGRVVLTNPAADLRNFEQLRVLKQRNPGLRTLLSVGGWDDSTFFGRAAATEESRRLFAQSCLELILAHGFDGIDLDWEYPVSGGPAGIVNSPADRENFTLLLAAVRSALDGQGRMDGRKYELTIAGAPGNEYLKKIEGQKVAELVDHIFVMGYDMHGSWDGYSDLTAPLWQLPGYSPQYKNCVSEGVGAWLSAGIPARKLVLGIPFYGYLYEGVRPEGQGLHSPFESARSISYDRVRQEYLNRPGMSGGFSEQAAVPWLYGNSLFISYEDARSVTAKAAWAGGMGLAGVGIWVRSRSTKWRS